MQVADNYIIHSGYYMYKPKTSVASFRLECLASAERWESQRTIYIVRTNHMRS